MLIFLAPTQTPALPVAAVEKFGLLKSCKSNGQTNGRSNYLGHFSCPPLLPTQDLCAQRKRFQFQPQQQQAQVPPPDGSLVAPGAPIIDPATGQMVVATAPQPQPPPVFVDGQQQFSSGMYDWRYVYVKLKKSILQIFQCL